MAWIESHQGLEKNGKLLELSNRLGINRYQAIGHLHALWWWALSNAEDGNLARFSNATITQACGWSEYIVDEIDASRINEMTNAEKGDEFVPALITCGFLDRENNGLWVHNWSDYTERYFKSIKLNKRIREQTKRRVEKHRKSNASVTQMKRSVTVPTIPYLTVPDLTKPKDKEPPIVPKGTEFDLIWNTYPKRVGKKSAERYYAASVKTAEDKVDIESALRRYLSSERVKAGYIQNGSTWFNNWRDWIRDPERVERREPVMLPKRIEPEPELSEEDRAAGIAALASIKEILRNGKEMPGK